jgi:glycosyltransferase involved in cell wall biosynthesis
MKFSIVITTYNRLELLKRAIDSALNQSLACEVVVADNASTDGTEAYVRGLEGVIYRRNPSNLNHAGAVNAGAEAATGDWIKLLDDDDYLAPTCIEQMTAAIVRHPAAVICACQAAQVSSSGKTLSCTPPPGPGSVFYVPQPAIHYSMFLERLPFGTPAQVAVQRAALLNSGGWDLTMTSCDDIDSWIRIAELGDALFVNECLAYRTVWPGGYDQKIDLKRRFQTNCLIKQRIYQRVSPQYRDHLPPFATIERYLRLHWGLVALKQRQLKPALALMLPVLGAWPAWQLLYQARRARANSATLSPVEATVLVA